MTIKVGDKAPDFELPGILVVANKDNGENRSQFQDVTKKLSELRGKKVIVSFYRYSACPFCNFRIVQLSKLYKQLLQQQHQKEGSAPLDVEILCIFHSPLESMKEYVGNQAKNFFVPFPLLYDPKEAIYELYHVKSSILGLLGALVKGIFCCKLLNVMSTLGFMPFNPEGTMSTLPADFLVDENGIVQDCFYATTIDEHIPWDRIDNFIHNNNEKNAANDTKV